MQIIENVIINEQNMCKLFPAQCMLRKKKSRAKEELIAEVRKDLGLEDLGPGA